MKIQMITPEFPPNCGGIGYYVFYLSKELLKNGHEVSVILRGKTDKNYSYKGLDVTELKILGIPPFNNFIFSKKIQKKLFDNSFNIIHIHSTSMPTLNTPIPIIVTSHCCIKENTLLFHRPIKSLDSLYRNLFYKLYCRSEENLIKKSNLLTVVSKSIQENYDKLYGVKSTIVYNGVDTKKFSPSKDVEPEKNILYYGALKWGKGLLDLLKAIKILNEKQRNYQLLIYGEGTLRKKIKKLIQKETLKNVFLYKPVDHSTLINILRKCSIFVLPSYYEGLPNSILEAMACGVPVIASNVKGNTEIVKNGFNGYLFEKGNPSDLAEKIEGLMESPSLRTEIAKNGRAFVCEHFTWDKVADRFISIYKQFI